MRLKQLVVPARIKKHVRATYGIVLLLFIAITVAAVFVIKTKEFAFESIFHVGAGSDVPAPFPVSVNPQEKLITENPNVRPYFEMHLSAYHGHPKRPSFFDRATAKLARFGWYQNLASPVGRVLVILPGERKEEVVDSFGDILKWDKQKREAFLEHIESTAPKIPDGKFFPGKYLVGKNATPLEIANMLTERFESEILRRYDDEVSALVPLEDALTIASLLEREAYDFEDMREIAGVIWNRLFIDMNLQLDASLQYAKGTESLYSWWPQVYPSDKYIDSPFNTYENAGLPPSPIGNPSLAAILAALNPIDTDCMYYFHDDSGIFHCTPTYEDHVRLLRQYYGRGK